MGVQLMKKIPLWVVASMGKQVVLVRDFVGACQTYPAGSKGTLTSIQDDDNGNCYATVGLDATDPDYWENFEFADIRPGSTQVKFTLDIEEGYIAF